MIKNETLLSNTEDMEQVLGALVINGEILYNTDYPLDEKDFVGFYRVVFSCINNLIRNGIRDFNDNMIKEYVEVHFNNWKEIYIEENPKGNFIDKIKNKNNIFNFEYHYRNVKKMSYLRDLNKNHFDISFLYDIKGENLDLNKEFDKSSVEELRRKFKNMLNTMDEKWVFNSSEDEKFSSDTITEEQLDEALDGKVEVGHKFPIGLEVLTHIFRGQLPQKYHLNMAGSGLGKTRMKMLEALNNSCEYMWDNSTNTWRFVGKSKPTLFISTEVVSKSLITMLIAIISGVEEGKIKRRKCTKEELNRVKKAREIFKKGLLYVEYMPNFTIETIESCIERYVLNQKIEFVYFDYIHASSSVIASIGKKIGKGVGTDKILEAFSIELKNLTNKYFLNFSTSCQVNRNAQGENAKSFGSVRGAYSLPDKFDNVMFSEIPSEREIDKFKDLGLHEGFLEPNFCITILKNRDGEHNDITLWFNLNRGNMRFHFINATDKEISRGYEILIDRYAYEKEESDDLEMIEFLSS